MSEARKLPPVDGRMETGPVQFGDDWPGIFIRGDTAFWFASGIRALMKKNFEAKWANLLLSELAELLESCEVKR